MTRWRSFGVAVCWVALVGAVVAVGSAMPRAVQAPTATTSSRTWIGRTAEIEAHLRTASVERIEEIGTGVTRPRRAYLKPAVPFDSLAWKVLPPGRRGGYWESYKSEIAAYELDKLLGMNMIPPAVERTIDGETGAAVMWLGSVKSVKETGGKVPSAPVWSKSIRMMLMFDDLVANIDRNAGNILLGSPGELILIDHSRAFGTDKRLVNQLQRVDATLWEHMRALTRADLDRTVGGWLDEDQIRAMLERREAMIAAVDKLVSKKGRALVIIP